MIFRPLAGAGAGKSFPWGMGGTVRLLWAILVPVMATQPQRKIPEKYFSGIFVLFSPLA
ncbi:MAG: hypothetical protein QM579_10650 [Desulfovibrio sp.]|uniref:hypothetical protein n=1 Tax=Desulfovibrio sp. TaxID=885 RepID=UPI0039E6BA3D